MQWNLPQAKEMFRPYKEESEESHARAKTRGVGVVLEEQRRWRTWDEIDLKILQWNADAILSCREELKEYVRRENVDILCIQETKLSEKDKTSQVQGYTVIRKDREQARGRESK